MNIEDIVHLLCDPISGADLRLSADNLYLSSDDNSYPIRDNIIDFHSTSEGTQNQTADAFAIKWNKRDKINAEKAEYRQKEWYLELYGFDSEDDLAAFLQTKQVIIDAGAGSGYKAAWFASLARSSTIIAIEIAESIYDDCMKYSNPNLFFIRGDISILPVKDHVADYISCDQVIHHASSPQQTFQLLCRKLKQESEFSCYVYRKKALPRELLDDHFRTKSLTMSKDELMEMSCQLTKLGKRLHSINIEFDCPEIPALGIKGGRTSIQRFLYWNFIKCFWNEELGEKLSTLCNFDWYAPSQASRYSKEAYLEWVYENKLEIIHFHEEEACFSGRFKKAKKLSKTAKNISLQSQFLKAIK
ncbi:MAG: methyltransferase domain-containing protein [Deltaproteobacteria bacterium]|nr:methyltransferase domain-containing protein [Deltaproteobacteria bacterium]